MTDAKILQDIADNLRIHSIRMTTEAGSGHPTSCMSMAEIMSVLFFDEMHYNVKNPNDWGNDEFVLSKGHAAPILWAAYAEAGIIDKKDLLTLRKIDSVLEGHPTPRMKWIKAATGSLGQGLSIGTGIAMAQTMAKSPARTFVVLGDGEMAEGSVWEACDIAAYYNLKKLYAIVDVNRLGQSQPTKHGHDVEIYKKKFEAFGWHALTIDGHDINEIKKVLKKANEFNGPCAIICKTIKGKGFADVSDKNGWHGVPLSKDLAEKAIKKIGGLKEIDSAKYVNKQFPAEIPKFKKTDMEFTKYKKGDNIATRDAYGNALVNLGEARTDVIALDGDVKNSTKAESFFEKFPNRSFENFIAEQNMVGMAIGLDAKEFMPFVSTFSAFITRAHDFIRMGIYSFTKCKFVGSHCGVSIGEDGPSQMGLEDIAMFRSIPKCIVLHPSDAVSTEYCVKEMVEHDCMAYLRTLRPKTPIIYDKNEKFPIGGSKVLAKSDKDIATVIAAGITVHEALKAHELLKKEKIMIQVIDAYSIEPLDIDGINKAVKRTNGKVVVAEDHYRCGGLGEAVLSSLRGEIASKHLCVRDIPRSGQKDELLDLYGINAKHIAEAVKELVKNLKKRK